jgi:hypothetical protein
MSKLSKNIFWLTLVVLAGAPAAFGQSDKIPPVFIDEWFGNRVLFFLVVGGVAGIVVALFWFPRLLPVPHRDDNVRALKHFFGALAVVILLLAAVALIDISTVYEFGHRSYSFKDSFFQIFLTWQAFLMLFIGAVAFTFVLAGWTRLSSKAYRYVLIRR